MDAGVVRFVDAGGGSIDGGAGTADTGPTLRVDAGGMTGTDSGARDAGCATAADCSDGLVCNGNERCESGTCAPGTPRACDDGVACTVDNCTEPTGACEYVPTDSMCASGESCDAVLGCRAGCAEAPCKLVAPQCGCPAGQGCYVDSTGSRLCTTAGANAEGAACTGLGSCTAGNLCVNIDRAMGATNQCMKFCSSDTQCSGGICLYTLSDGMGGSLPGVRLCTRNCDPVAQSGCRTGAYCDIFRETAGAMRWFTDCTAPAMGSGRQGAACATLADCAAGFTCVDPGDGLLECMEWCNVTTGTGCSFPFTCVGFAPAITTSTTEYGVCF